MGGRGNPSATIVCMKPYYSFKRQSSFEDLHEDKVVIPGSAEFVTDSLISDMENYLSIAGFLFVYILRRSLEKC